MKKILIGILVILITVSLFFTFNKKGDSIESLQVEYNEDRIEESQEETIQNPVVQEVTQEANGPTNYESCKEIGGYIILEKPKSCSYEDLYYVGEESPMTYQEYAIQLQEQGYLNFMPDLESCKDQGGVLEVDNFNRRKCTLNGKEYFGAGIRGDDFREMCRSLEGSFSGDPDNSSARCRDKNEVMYYPAYS